MVENVLKFPLRPVVPELRFPPKRKGRRTRESFEWVILDLETAVEQAALGDTTGALYGLAGIMERLALEPGDARKVADALLERPELRALNEGYLADLAGRTDE